MVLKALIPTWGALGFYRGCKLYNWDYKEDCILYNKEENKKYYKKPQYFFSSCAAYGLTGIIFYANPFFLVITFSKEIYRAEVNIRGLNEEKEKRHYYTLI